MILKRSKGFTLIELMIVVAILGILAAIAIPRFAQMIEKAKEGATKGNLATIRSSCSIYYGDNEGIYPDAIDVAAFGTYLSRVPPAKATPLGNTNAVTAVTAAPSAAGVGWAYCSSSGESWGNSTATDTKGLSFTTY